jgi:hypothetical protein
MSPLLPRGGPDRLGSGLLLVIFMKKTLSATRPQDRRAVLSQRRGLKMARSAHAYVRGNTLQFYEWFASATGKLLPRRLHTFRDCTATSCAYWTGLFLRLQRLFQIAAGGSSTVASNEKGLAISPALATSSPCPGLFSELLRRPPRPAWPAFPRSP